MSVSAWNTVTLVLGCLALGTCDYRALDVTKNVAAVAVDPGFPPASLSTTHTGSSLTGFLSLYL